MRDIKFRAWNYNEMIYNVSIRNSLIQNHLDKFDYIKSSNYPIMQYTGLKDKNCKEIYEGDIINHRYSEKGKNNYIVWDNINLQFCLNDMSYQVLANDEWYNTSQLEIIGNIYENTELL